MTTLETAETIASKGIDDVPFEATYAALPERFTVRVAPTPVSTPKLVKLNERLARELGLDVRALQSPAGVAMLSGNQVAAHSTPIAMAYAGHQFGNFVPQLGDGRAILLGELKTRSGVRRDVQLKGSGPTPFSRRGDGRAALGPVLREYIMSEAFHALRIPATGALAAVTTGEWVLRDPPAPGAILTRIAASHIRVGTFQYFAARGDTEGIRTLADYCIARHDLELVNADEPYLAFLKAVISRQATLIARWMHIGFIHGVMNTDNMAVAGETIDFGPCAMMDTYHPGTVYSSIDHTGRYAYANQPRIAQWNLTRLAETLVPLLDDNQDAAVAKAQDAINGFGAAYERAYEQGMRSKLGLVTEEDGDVQLGLDLLTVMADQEADFTLTFRHLSSALEAGGDQAPLRSQFKNPDALDAWIDSWRERHVREVLSVAQRGDLMRKTNPLYIPRNHLVEEALSAAVNREDFEPFETLLRVLERPFEDQPGRERYALPPTPEQVVHQTFCGT